MTLGEKVKQIEARDPYEIISLKNEYGVVWTGQARFAFGAVTYEAWNRDSLEVIERRK